MKILNPENIDFQCIQNILFDWGGVITNIDHNLTIDAFKKLGMDNFHEYFTHAYQNKLFRNFEVGRITAAEMRQELRQALNTNVSDQEIDNAWCKMLKETPKINIDILQLLKNKFSLYLLSNTNEIHATFYNNKLQIEYNIHFPSLFQKAYYSHTTGMRKPNKDIFEFVLKDADMKAEETLFIDDTEVNIDTADKLGFHSFFIQNKMQLQDIFIKFLK
jgi:putative hydrolase of the HAD superfamily